MKNKGYKTKGGFVSRFEFACSTYGPTIVEHILRAEHANYTIPIENEILHPAKYDNAFQERLIWNKDELTRNDWHAYIRPLFLAFAEQTDPGGAPRWKYLNWICRAILQTGTSGPICYEMLCMEIYKRELRKFESLNSLLEQRDIYGYKNLKDLARALSSAEQKQKREAEEKKILSGRIPEGDIAASSEQAANVFEPWANTYDHCAAHCGWSAPETLARSLSRIFNEHSGAPVKILDVGAGTGILSQHLRAAIDNSTIDGVDISREMLEKAKTKGALDNAFVADIQHEKLPYADGTFDITASCGMFEYIEDPHRALAEMSRVTKPGGLLVFTTQEGHGRGNNHSAGLIQKLLNNSGIGIVSAEMKEAYSGISYNFFVARKHGLEASPSPALPAAAPQMATSLVPA